MRVVLMVLALLASLLAPTAVVTANEAPLADAGLDQSVPEGTTVYLDATGSRDPDGSIAGYEWVIEAPNGSTLLPDDLTDPRTSFVPDRPGRYEVTVIVTDDQGVTARDTLYVDVDAAPEPPDGPSGPDTDGPDGDPPGPPDGVPSVPGRESPSPGGSDVLGNDGCSVEGGSACTVSPLRAEITGPSRVPADADAVFRLWTSASNDAVVSREWTVLGKQNDFSSGSPVATGEQLRRTFGAEDVGRTVTLSVTVTTEDGNSTTATKQVEVFSPDKKGLVEIVGPSEMDEDSTNMWRVRAYNVEIKQYKWKNIGKNGPEITKAWNIPDPKKETRKEVLKVEIVLMNGSVIYRSTSVTIKQVQNRVTTEIDQTKREGIEGTLRDVHDLLAGERRQREVGPGSYYYGDNPNDMKRADSVDPDTTMVDDYDPGVLDDLSNKLEQQATGLRQAGNHLNTDITSTGDEVESAFDESADDIEETVDSSGKEISESLSESGEEVDDALTEAGTAGGRAAEGLVTTAIDSSVLSADNNPSGYGVSDEQAQDVGEAAGTGIETAVSGVGSAYEEGSEAVGSGIEAAVEAGGDAVRETVETGGDVARASADYVGNKAEDVADAAGSVTGYVSEVVSTADDQVDEKLPGDDGEDDGRENNDSGNNDTDDGVEESEPQSGGNAGGWLVR